MIFKCITYINIYICISNYPRSLKLSQKFDYRTELFKSILHISWGLLHGCCIVLHLLLSLVHKLLQHPGLLLKLVLNRFELLDQLVTHLQGLEAKCHVPGPIGGEQYKPKVFL